MAATRMRDVKALTRKLNDSIHKKTGISFWPLLQNMRVMLRSVPDWCVSHTRKFLLSFTSHTRKLLVSFTTNNYVLYDDVKVPLFYHNFNCGNANERTTERTVELGIALYWLSKYNTNLVEIGAVTPYYFPGLVKEIIDPADKNEYVNIKKSLFDVDITGKNILSISTVEHVGTGNYNLSRNESSINALGKILHDSSACLVTIPIGFNKILDSYIQSGAVADIARIDIYFRSKQLNNWRHTRDLNIIGRIPYGPHWANGLIIISKQ